MWRLDPKGGWPRFLWRFIPVIAVLLVPWPGLASPFAETAADGLGVLAMPISTADAEIHFMAGHYGNEHPWWVQMSVKNVFTNQAFEVPVDTRTVAYIRIVVFLSLAIAWPFWTSRRRIVATAAGFAGLIGLILLSVELPLLQVLGMVRVLELGRFAQSLISVGILTLVTYPSMAFAVPAFVWFVTLRASMDRAPPAKRAARRSEPASPPEASSSSAR
jgi:hypothetical protein